MTVADPTELRQPPYGDTRGVARLSAEIIDHLWPWRRGSGGSGLARGAGIALALAATVAWILTALGHLSAGAIIGWWFGWSVLEVRVRHDAKPYVKDGPWWGRRYRRANLMDLICYVSFKNLLIGAALFIGLKTAGLLVV